MLLLEKIRYILLMFSFPENLGILPSYLIVFELEFYFLQVYTGPSLESLTRGDTVGLYVNTDGELHFMVKGKDQGVAVDDIPIHKDIYVVADIYGQVKQISINSTSPLGTVVLGFFLSLCVIAVVNRNTWPVISESGLAKIKQKSRAICGFIYWYICDFLKSFALPRSIFSEIVGYMYF